MQKITPLQQSQLVDSHTCIRQLSYFSSIWKNLGRSLPVRHKTKLVGPEWQMF